MTKKKQELTWKKVCIVGIAIACLTLLECVAIMNGINGILFTFVIATIAGLAGYIVPSPFKK